MKNKTLTELKIREKLLYYMKNGQEIAFNKYLDVNKKLECGISLPKETIFSLVCDDLFYSIDEESIFYDDKTKTELLLSRAIVDNNPYKLEFGYVIEQRDKHGSLLSSEDFEIGEEAELLQLLDDLGVLDDIL